MSNCYFQFQQFTVWHDRCAMKVGTDGTLLGAWARGGYRVLDIGTGSGLIALMMAQRYAEAEVMGVEIDGDAVRQARQNADASPFAKRITIMEGDITDSTVTDSLANTPFDAIVCNPPYFIDSLECPNPQRTTARHASSLSYAGLMDIAARLLADNGQFSLVIPANGKQRIEDEAAHCHLYKQRECAVNTTPSRPSRRFLLAFGHHRPQQVEQAAGVLEEEPGRRSPWYNALTEGFYLRMKE